MKNIRIGTRGSPLALAQASLVQSLLGGDASIHIYKTTGDIIQDKPLSEVGGKGLFTKEIQEALLNNEIDIAVHSSKDMATQLPEGLELAAFLPREDVRDMFISPYKFADLPLKAVIGTASLRRVAQVKALRPDLTCINFRGNVQTRLRKLEEKQVQGTILALAGLNRLGMDVASFEMLPFLPACGQGAIAIETRIGDANLVAKLNEKDTQAALLCERAFLHALNGSCRTPIAGYAVAKGENLSFEGEVYSFDGAQIFKIKAEGLSVNAANIGTRAGEDLLTQIPQGLWA